ASLTPSSFLTTGSLTTILNNQGVLALVSLGLTAPLLCGELDLSVAAITTFTGAFTAGLVSDGTISPWAALLVGVLVGSLIGIVNWSFGTVCGISSLISTLAMATLFEGLTLWYTQGETIFRNLGSEFTQFGRWDIVGLQAPVIYMLVVACLLAVF